MKPIQRQYGKIMHKGAGDTAKVSVLLNDYEDADKMLTKVCARFTANAHYQLTFLADHRGLESVERCLGVYLGNSARNNNWI